MGYTVESVERMAEKLRALPPVEKSKRQLNKQEAVKQLADEIVALQGKGYTIEQITESLRGVGLEINTPTLKSYLHRAKPAKRKGSRGSARARTAPPSRAAEAEPQLSARVAESKESEQQDPKKDEAPKKGGKDAFLVKDKDSY